MQAPIINHLPVTVIRRERLLPFPGEITVREGQSVRPTDVIAEVDLSLEHMVLNLTRGLGISVERVDKYVQRSVGDRVAKGDVIAGPVGLGRRVVRAPSDGKLIAVGGGKVLLQVEKPPSELRAGIPGEVREVVEDVGVVIETTGSLIQGVWGNGKADMGIMQVLAKSPDDELAPGQLDVSFRGAVIMGAYCANPDTLKVAAEILLRGLILASMPYYLVPIAKRQPFPIVVIEGFGRLPMNSAAYQLLTSNPKRDVAIYAEPLDHYTGSRPEVIILLPEEVRAEPPVDIEYWRPGLAVRVTHPPYVTKIGTLLTLPDGLVTFPNGVRAPGAKVRLESGEDVMIPLANLQVLKTTSSHRERE
ncbi:MAG: hypothetical protein AB1345_05245 [Chloroflexota bacterium]